MRKVEQPIDQWIRELKEAGWRKHSMTVWVSPDGTMYRGPYKAWEVMKRLQAERGKGE